MDSTILLFGFGGHFYPFFRIVYGGPTLFEQADLLSGATSYGGFTGNRSHAAIGDINGDGFDDVVLAGDGVMPADVKHRRVEIVFGSPDSDLETSTVAFPNLGANWMALSVAGDLNLDGYVDLSIDSPGGEDMVIFGGPRLRELNATLDMLTPEFAYRGPSIREFGDFNGDGVIDYLIDNNSILLGMMTSTVTTGEDAIDEVLDLKYGTEIRYSVTATVDDDATGPLQKHTSRHCWRLAS